MPAPIASRPIQRQQTTTATAVESPPSQPAHTAQGHEEVQERAVDQLLATSTQPRQRARLQSTVRALAAAFRRDGAAGVRTYLEQNPSALQTLGRESAARTEAMLARATRSETNAGQIVGVIQDSVSGAMRQMLSREVRTAMNRHIGNLQALERHIEANLDRYRNAAPGSADAQVAERLGIRGLKSDMDRVQAVIEQSIRAFDAVLNRIIGQAWQPNDFAETGRRLAVENGFGIGAHGTFTGNALMRDISEPVIHAGVQSVEITHMAIEALAHGVAALPAILVGAVGLAAGIVIHRAVEEDRAAFRTLVNRLGIR